MVDDAKKPPLCIHCVIVDAINAHGEAHPSACHCEACLTMALAEVIRDVLSESGQGKDCGQPSTARH